MKTEQITGAELIFFVQGALRLHTKHIPESQFDLQARFRTHNEIPKSRPDYPLPLVTTLFWLA